MDHDSELNQSAVTTTSRFSAEEILLGLHGAQAATHPLYVGLTTIGSIPELEAIPLLDFCLGEEDELPGPSDAAVEVASVLDTGCEKPIEAILPSTVSARLACPCAQHDPDRYDGIWSCIHPRGFANPTRVK